MKQFDVTVIGGGVVGCCVARELSKYYLRVLLLEKEADVSCGTSGANSGVVHSGFKEEPGSLKAEYSIQGNKVFPKLCRDLGVPFRRLGTLMVAVTESEVDELDKIVGKAEKNGVPDVQRISGRELARLEPNVAGVEALLARSGGIVTPYLLTIALAENAQQNGAKFKLNSEVKAVSKDKDSFKLKTTNGTFTSEYVVNCAGLYSDRVASLTDNKKHKIYPCRGEYLILDKRVHNLINSMVYPVMSAGLGEVGVHLTPTLEDNILLGPTDEYIIDKSDVSTTAEKTKELITGAKHLVPNVSSKDIIRSYSGIRSRIVSKTSKVCGDFIIEEAPDGFISLLGIESPGLTAAPILAEKVVELIGNSMELKPNPKFNPVRKNSQRFDSLPAKSKSALIKSNPDYGEIVCRCENVTKGEILGALNNPLGVRTLKGLKYRCRVLMGRCQGGVCLPKIAKIYDELGIALDDVTLKGEGSELFAGWSR